MTQLLFLAGSARKESLNKKLAGYAANVATKLDGVAAQFIDLKDFSMPIYDGDHEAADGLPDAAIALKKLFQQSHGIFIASPEYNSSFSPLLKNALDWISRPHEKNEAPLVAYRGKVFALAAVSPGALGGLRGLVPLRMMLGNVGAWVSPNQVAVGGGGQAFDAEGKMIDDKQAGMIKQLVADLAQAARQLSSP